MLTLVRESFPDRLMSRAQLVAAAELWRLWAAASSQQRVAAACGRVRLDASVYGGSRAEAEAAARTFPGARVGAGDALEVFGIETPGDAVVNPAAWDFALAHAAGRAAVVTLGVVVVGGARSNGTYDSVNELMMVGATPEEGAAGGGILLKSLWNLGAADVARKMVPWARWDGEEAFLRSLDALDRTGDFGEALAAVPQRQRSPFLTRHEERVAGEIVRLAAEMPG